VGIGKVLAIRIAKKISFWYYRTMFDFAEKNAARRNLPVEKLRRMALDAQEMQAVSGGSVNVNTGKYTGRSPSDRFIVASPSIKEKIGWNQINVAVSPETFDYYLDHVVEYLSARDAFVFDGTAGAEGQYSLPIRVVTENAYEALFAEYMFLQSAKPLATFAPELTVLAAPGCRVAPRADGPRAETFILLDLERRIVLIGGTAYCGEIKKAVFSVLNFLLPDQGIMPMHCSATAGRDGRTALYFGLSGTGKTTLSSDPERSLIGDDEHGWSATGIFNFENGCYAKCIHLNEEQEPYIWQAVQRGALLENVVLDAQGNPDFDDGSLTENTRAAYPLSYSPLAESTRQGKSPNTVVFLTADAFGVLPPVSRLTTNGALYHFLSGYTSKIAGTERGVKEPSATFSSCFGAPFMPRHIGDYAELLRQRLAENNSEVFLLNTGWCRGPYGTGTRFKLQDTRTILRAVLAGELSNVPVRHDDRFNLDVPQSVPGLDAELLDPAALWPDRAGYDRQADILVEKFLANAGKQLGGVSSEILAAGPRGSGSSGESAAALGDQS
jgi:phosphoenolpyruvate carboxykinase (ATP)